MSSNPVITQTPNPFTPDASAPNNTGQVIYTDLSYNIVPDISNNPTYTLRTNVSDPTNDVFTSSTSVPQAFIPNSLFISSTNLSQPVGMARDSLGYFYVANASGSPGTISVYTPAGAFDYTITLDSGGSDPNFYWVLLRYLAFDELDNLYVSCEFPRGIAYVAAGALRNTYAKTIFPDPNPYSIQCRGLAYHNGYLYIVIKSSPGYVIKYNVTTDNYLLLDMTGYLSSGQAPNTLTYNQLYTGPSSQFLYLVSSNFMGGTGGNKLFGISEITGTESPTGGTGTATITLLTTFDDTQYPYSIVVDNSANLYSGLAINNSQTIGQIARITSEGTISNISYLSLSSSGPITGRSYGLIFDGSLNLYATDISSNRVIKSQPKTFVFGGPSTLNTNVFKSSSTTTYLYNTTNATSVTTFSLNIECFKKGTKILCDNDMYIPIEELKTGDLVKTYKHGYQKVIMSTHSRLCDCVQSTYNQLYTYSREKNPDLIEDLHLTGGHSFLLDTLTEEESTNMKQIQWPNDEFMVEDKYKLLACFSSELYVATEQHADVYHFTLEPPENTKSSHVYGVYANGILAESCSQWAMEEALKKNKML